MQKRKTEINKSISELTNTNEEKVKDLETKIMKGEVDLSEMNKLMTDQIKVVNTTLESLNNKDVLTAEDIKGINNTLTTSLKDIETKMVDFNKKFIDTEELQSEINKMKNEIINSNKNKDLAVTNLMKTDIENIKSSNEELKKMLMK